MFPLFTAVVTFVVSVAAQHCFKITIVRNLVLSLLLAGIAAGLSAGVNAVVISIIVMMVLCLYRTPVVFALMIAAIVGGLQAGMEPAAIVDAFNGGLVNGARVALAYAILGVFAVMLSRSGLTEKLSATLIARVSGENAESHISIVKYSLYFGLICMGFASQTIVPVHIAFIPILVPPLLKVMNHLNLDRRAVASCITFSITVMYMCAPVGFGAIYLNDILMENINVAGKAVNSGTEVLSIAIESPMLPKAMLIPGLGMVVGLLIAIFISYRKKRSYQDLPIEGMADMPTEAGKQRQLHPRQIAIIVLALITALAVQLLTDSMIFGGICGCTVMSFSGTTAWSEQDSVFIQGLRLLAVISFVMITANGFAGVMKESGAVPELVSTSMELFGDSKGLAALVMLIVGLFITMGIGSSFSTVPIIATIFVPLCLTIGFSPLATIAIVGTAGALGDAGSPSSDSTLGPTAGLNADGQHDHIWDTVVPTFLHFNVPLVLFGWIAAMVL